MFIPVLIFILALVVSYFLGSINWAIIISKIVIKEDVRKHGSGNAGMTNVMRTAGKWPAVLTLLGDIIKGAAAVGLGRYILFPYIFSQTGLELFAPVYGVFLCGIFCMLGHIFPVFFGFKGGKAVATTVGITLMIDFRITLCAVLVFLIIFLFTKIVSLGSIFAAASVVLFTGIYFPLWGFDHTGNRLYVILLSAVFALIIICKHRSNIVRLIHGEEKKLASKSKKGEN